MATYLPYHHLTSDLTSLASSLQKDTYWCNVFWPRETLGGTHWEWQSRGWRSQRWNYLHYEASSPSQLELLKVSQNDVARALCLVSRGLLTYVDSKWDRVKNLHLSWRKPTFVEIRINYKNVIISHRGNETSLEHVDARTCSINHCNLLDKHISIHKGLYHIALIQFPIQINIQAHGPTL